MMNVAVAAVLVALLFFLYWRQSSSAPTNADGASNALQAWDMLHGNLLLHGWTLSDVSFYTTELPQYMLIEAVFGLGPWVVHVAAAMTYTLLVILAALLAKGRAGGLEGLTRALLAAGLIVAPQLSATSTLLLGPDHTGTAVPLLVAWLIIDVAPRRWYVPVAVCLILGWTLVADSLVLITGIAPVAVACAIRASLGWRSRRASAGFELSLAAAAAAAAGLGWIISRGIRAIGGYVVSPVPTGIVSAGQLPHTAWVTARAALEVFGANIFSAGHGIAFAFVALHVVGAALVVVAMAAAMARSLRTPDLVIPVLALAIVFNLAAYMTSRRGLDIAATREIAAVMPFGAALAGRILAGRILAAPVLAARPPAGPVLRLRLVPVLALVACGYLAALGYAAALPPAPAANEPLAAWLAAHHLSDGLAGYWQANSTTLDTRGRIQVSSVQVSNGRLVPGNWETVAAAYDPARHDGQFVAVKDATVTPNVLAAAATTFGPPVRTYHAAGYTIFVWNRNLLSRLAPAP